MKPSFTARLHAVLAIAIARIWAGFFIRQQSGSHAPLRIIQFLGEPEASASVTVVLSLSSEASLPSRRPEPCAILPRCRGGG